MRPAPGRRFELAGLGTVVRDLAADTASSGVHRWWPDLRTAGVTGPAPVGVAGR